MWKTSQAQSTWRRVILAGLTAAKPLLPSFATIAHSVLCHCAEGACLLRFCIPQEALWLCVQSRPARARPTAPQSLSSGLGRQAESHQLTMPLTGEGEGCRNR